MQKERAPVSRTTASSGWTTTSGVLDGPLTRVYFGRADWNTYAVDRRKQIPIEHGNSMTPQQRHSALSLEIAPTSASFLSATLEHDFREEAFAAHCRRAFPIVGFVALLQATLIYRELVNLGVSDEFYDVLLLRAPPLMFYVLVLVVLARVRSARVMDHVLLVWSLSVLGASIYLHLSLLLGALGGLAIGLKKWREEGPTSAYRKL